MRRMAAVNVIGLVAVDIAERGEALIGLGGAWPAQVRVMHRVAVDLYADEWAHEMLDAASEIGAHGVGIDSLGDLQMAIMVETHFLKPVFWLALPPGAGGRRAHDSGRAAIPRCDPSGNRSTARRQSREGRDLRRTHGGCGDRHGLARCRAVLRSCDRPAEPCSPARRNSPERRFGRRKPDVWRATEAR